MGKFEQEPETPECSLAASPFKVEQENSNKKLRHQNVVLTAAPFKVERENSNKKLRCLNVVLTAAPFKVERENSNKKLAKEKRSSASVRVEMYEKG